MTDGIFSEMTRDDKDNLNVSRSLSKKWIADHIVVILDVHFLGRDLLS